MSDNLQALIQERASRVAEMRTMVDAAELRGAPTAEDQAAIDRINADISGTRDADGTIVTAGLDQRIANIRQIRSLESADTTGGDDPSIGQRAQAPDPAASEIRGGEDAEYRDAFDAMLRNTASDEQLRALRRGYVDEQYRDQVKGTAANGGYVAPTTFEAKVLKRVEDRSVIRQVFTNVLRTANGNKITLTAEDARGAAAWIDEGAAFTSTDDTWAQIDIQAWKAGRLAKASIELVEDAMFDLESYLANSIGDSLAALEDAAFVNGDGSSKPTGALAASGGFALGVTAASPTAITFDEIIDLEFSVRPAYRRFGEFIVADEAVKTLRKIKDVEGQYIWRDGVTIGEASSLHGRKVTTEPNMAAPAAGTKPLLFGDPSTYQIREVSGIRLAVLRELYLATSGKYGYLGWRRVDGKALDTAGMKHLKMAAS